MNEKAETVEKYECVVTVTNYETGERRTETVEGTLRRNPRLTPEEREKYIRFKRQRQGEIEAAKQAAVERKAEREDDAA